jgi:hypothetical protein
MKIGENEASDFVKFCVRGHENWRKLKHLTFLKFCAHGVMKVEKIEASDFFEVSCTRVMKIGENFK